MARIQSLVRTAVVVVEVVGLDVWLVVEVVVVHVLVAVVAHVLVAVVVAAAYGCYSTIRYLRDIPKNKHEN